MRCRAPNRSVSLSCLFYLLYLVAPQGFEPRYAAPEAAVLPLNEGAVKQDEMAWRCFAGDHFLHSKAGSIRGQRHEGRRCVQNDSCVEVRCLPEINPVQSEMSWKCFSTCFGLGSRSRFLASG